MIIRGPAFWLWPEKPDTAPIYFDMVKKAFFFFAGLVERLANQISLRFRKCYYVVIHNTKLSSWGAAEHPQVNQDKKLKKRKRLLLTGLKNAG